MKLEPENWQMPWGYNSEGGRGADSGWTLEPVEGEFIDRGRVLFFLVVNKNYFIKKKERGLGGISQSPSKLLTCKISK